MNRQQCEQLLAAYLLDELDAGTRAELDAALETDAALRDRLADLRLTLKFMHQGLAEEGQPRLSDSRRNALLGAVAQIAPPPAKLKKSWWRRPLPVSLTAVAAILVVAVLLSSVLLPTLGRSRELARQSIERHDEVYGYADQPRVAAPSTDEVAQADYPEQRFYGGTGRDTLSGHTSYGKTGTASNGSPPAEPGSNFVHATGDRSILALENRTDDGKRPAGVTGRYAHDLADSGGNHDATFESWSKKSADELRGKDMYALADEAGKGKANFYWRDGTVQGGALSGNQPDNGRRWAAAGGGGAGGEGKPASSDQRKEATPNLIGPRIDLAPVAPATPLPIEGSGAIVLPPAGPDDVAKQTAPVTRARLREQSKDNKPTELPWYEELQYPKDWPTKEKLEGRLADSRNEPTAPAPGKAETPPPAGAPARPAAKPADPVLAEMLNKEVKDAKEDAAKTAGNVTIWNGRSARAEVNGGTLNVTSGDGALVREKTGIASGHKVVAEGDKPAGDAAGKFTLDSSVSEEKPLGPASVSRLVPTPAPVYVPATRPASALGLSGSAARDYVAHEESGDRLANEESGREKGLPPASTFREVPVNPWVMTERDRFSTFASDVDSASYSLCRAYLRSGYLPPRGAVRMEEFVNAFDYNYPRQAKGVFNIFAQAAPAPFAAAGEDTTLLKIGVQGRVVGREGRKIAHLVFVIDTSGSMATPDRLPLVQESLRMLVAALSPDDRVSLVTYNREASLLLEAVPASKRDEILAACEKLRAGGSTNLLAGLEAGYDLARREFVAGRINRVILCSDGAANIGQTDSDAILEHVAGYRRHGITLTVAGFGRGGYNDELMETLAKRGDGSYLFIDTPAQARQAFVEKMTATLQTIALDAKIQIEFDPTRVRRYRLIGYEKRAIADEDFRNDAVAAAQVGSGQSATALYEVELTGKDPDQPAGNLGTVYVRYRDPDGRQVDEISQPINARIVKPLKVEQDPRFYLAACAARFAEILRESPHAKNAQLGQVEGILRHVTKALPLDNRAGELLSLVQRAKDLPHAP